MRRGLRVYQGAGCSARTLGFSLCAAPLDTYCPRISDVGLEVWMRSLKDNQCQFQTEEHTGSLEHIYIGIGHIRVTRIEHISGSGFRVQTIEQGEQKCEVKRKHETEQSLET